MIPISTPYPLPVGTYIDPLPSAGRSLYRFLTQASQQPRAESVPTAAWAGLGGWLALPGLASLAGLECCLAGRLAGEWLASWLAWLLLPALARLLDGCAVGPGCLA